MEAAFFKLAFLFRYDALWQVAPAVVGALGKIGIGLPDIYLGAGGTQLGPRRVSWASSSGVSINARTCPLLT